MARDYRVILEPEEEGGYSVWVPALPGCVSQGDSPEEALANTLTLWGYEAIAALDGEEALQKVAAEHPDLLILDLVLPKLDGWRVCQRLKTDDRYRKIPIILTSGVLRKESDAAEPMAEVELADAILAKPFHTDHLRALIEKLLPPC